MRRCLALILLVGLAVPAASQQYALRQYLNIRSAIAPTLSPDGAQVGFIQRVTGTGQLWRVPAASGWPDQLTFFNSSISGAAWSPAGEWILVSADHDGDEQFQLYLVNPDGARQV